MDDVLMSAGRLKAWLRDYGRAKSGAVWCDDLERVIEAAFATSEQTRRAEWAELLAKVSLDCRTYQSGNVNGLWINHGSEGRRKIPCAFDASGLPIETPELRAALEAALNT
jgi:hypothetical protein